MTDLCDAVFAEPMLEGGEYLKTYAKQLQDLQKQGQLPDLKKTLTYNVYSIGGSDFGAHKSIVLSSDKKHFVTVELGFITVDGQRHIYPVTRALASNLIDKLEFHGTVNMSGQDLITRAVATMQKFGNKYFKYCNNCQDFCNMFLESIGLGKSKKLTDGDKAGLVVLAGAILLLLIKLFGK